MFVINFVRSDLAADPELWGRLYGPFVSREAALASLAVLRDSLNVGLAGAPFEIRDDDRLMIDPDKHPGFEELTEATWAELFEVHAPPIPIGND